MRGQANLFAVAVALLLVVASATVAVGVLDGALATATRDPGERRAAAATAARLVAPDGPLAAHPNVVTRQSLAALDAAALRRAFPDRDVRIRVDGETIARTGTPSGGRTVRRLVLLVDREPEVRRPVVGGDRPRSIVMSADAGSAVVELSPAENSTVTALRVGGRTAWRNPGGLTGEFAVSLPDERTRLAFVGDGNGSLGRRTVVLTQYRRETREATLAVTVDA